MSNLINHNNGLSKVNDNHFWLTRPPPSLTPIQNRTPIYNLNYGLPFNRPYAPSYNRLNQRPTSLSYSYDISNLNHQDHYNQYTNNLFPPLPENIDEEYILKYLCPLPKPHKDETTIWIENWLANKNKDITVQKVKQTNVKVFSVNK
jgi:hypothetical protein